MEIVLNQKPFKELSCEESYTINGGGSVSMGLSVVGLVVSAVCFALGCLTIPAPPLAVGLSFAGVVIAVLSIVQALVAYRFDFV